MYEIVIAVAAGIAVIISVFGSHYIYIIGKLHEQAAKAIDKAESTLQKGSEKFNLAVDSLMALIPRLLKPFIRRGFIEKLVQSVFDKIQSYAQKQVNKKDK